MIKYFVCFVCCCFSAQTQAANWQIIDEKSSLTFSAVQQGEAFSGQFEQFSATIDFDPAQPEQGHVKVVVAINSVNTNNEERDVTLMDMNWFDVQQFGQAVFESQSIRKVAENQFEAKGNLTIKGITQPLILPFTLKPEGKYTRAIGHVMLNRPDFKLGLGEWAGEDWVGYRVKIEFDLLALPIEREKP